jgi:fructose-1,6-bisphosphatase/inositol monophosphatase family enzyme
MDRPLSRWVIDPIDIDGAMNFMRSLSNNTISIGWDEQAGNLLGGFIYAVRQNEIFGGCVGFEATCNYTPIFVSIIDDTCKASLVCVNIPETFTSPVRS